MKLNKRYLEYAFWTGVLSQIFVISWNGIFNNLADAFYQM